MGLATYFRKREQQAEEDQKFALTARGFRLCQGTADGETDITAQHVAQLREAAAEYGECIRYVTKA